MVYHVWCLLVQVYGGTIRAGHAAGESLDIVSAFQAYGEFAYDRITEVRSMLELSDFTQLCWLPLISSMPRYLTASVVSKVSAAPLPYLGGV